MLLTIRNFWKTIVETLNGMFEKLDELATYSIERRSNKVWSKTKIHD